MYIKCSSRPFKALSIAVFSGAFSEIAFKIGIFLLFAKPATTALGHSALFFGLAVLPALPSVFLSPYVGVLLDRIPKANVVKFAKFLELIFALIGAYSLAGDRTWALVAIVFLMGLTSAIFTPAKFALIPGMLSSKDISRGNGYLQFAKYLGYLAAIMMVGAVMIFDADVTVVLSSFTSAVAACGFAASIIIKPQPVDKLEPEDEIFTFDAPIRGFREIKKNRYLLLTMISFALFMVMAAVFELNTSLYLQRSVEFSQVQITFLLCALCVGIALGGLFAGHLSQGKVEVGIVPISAVFVGFCLLLMSLILQHHGITSITYFLCGFFGGAAVVPLNAYFQQQSPINKRGTYQGVSNAVTHIGMLIVAAPLVGLEGILDPDPRLSFFIAGFLTLLIAIYTLKALPMALVRCLNFIFTTTVYKIRMFGAENVPETGGAVLVCNHISYFDPSLVAASIPRNVRFLISRPLFDHPVMRFILNSIKAIPVSPKDGPRALLSSINEAREAARNGEIVCVFAEGEPTRLGHMLPFGRGLEKIMKGLDVPLIPVYLDQTWGSLFDYRDGKYVFRMPKELPYPTTLTFGPPLIPSMKSYEVRQIISELGTTAFTKRQREHQYLHLGFIKTAKRRLFRVAMVESSGKKARYFHALVGTFLFTNILKKILDPSRKNVGILLPPCIAAAYSNLALLMRGLAPINLNYTFGKEASASCIQQAEIKQVITSRLFLSKITPPEGVEFLYAEDLAAKITKKDKLLAMLFVLFTPSWVMRWMFKTPTPSPDALATIVFSSGSTGIPKGIMLSHGNITSNVEGMYTAVAISHKDVIVGVLPFFHSFGYATCLWLPLLGGIKVLYHYSPLEAEAIGTLIEKEGGTIMLGTPSFLLSYIRRITKEQMRTIRLTVLGAEKLRKSVAQAFTDKFGLTPLEGYGCTELSPVAAVNVPDVKEKSRDQIGNKPGTVGHTITGVAVRIVDPETREILPPKEMGLVLIKGPNVMMGYLNAPDLTAEVVWDGWYVTGDLGSLDEGGFVTLHDRVSRFSKIAGEMVPHAGIEDAIQKLSGEIEQICAVAGVPDEKRGERLVVLYSNNLEPREVVKALSDSGYPNLWIPRADDFHKVDSIPMLGSGKLDLQGIKRKSKELS